MNIIKFVLCYYHLIPDDMIRKFALCFQFGGLGTLDQHGFARNRFWAIDDDPPPFPTNTLSKAFVDLILKPTEEDTKIWPHRYL